MASVSIRAERPTMTVDIGGEREVAVPLTFNRAEFSAMTSAESNEDFMFWFFGQYLGEDVMDAIGDDDLTRLVKAFSAEREKMGEPSMGESSASPKR